MQSVIDRVNLHRRARMGLAACLVAASGWIHAHNFCATSVSEFQSALTQSSDGGMYAGEDNNVLLVGKTYTTASAAFHYYLSNAAHALNVFGGYGPNCSVRTAQTPPTILDGGGTSAVLSLGNKFGDIFVSGLTLQNGESNSPGAGLQINYLVTVNGAVYIYDTIIRNNHSTVSAGGLYVSAGSTNNLTANLITDNSADGQYGAAYVTGYGNISLFYNNTVSKNTSAAATNPVGGLFCAGTASCEFHDNIFWNNTNYGLYLGSSGGVLSYNDIGTLGGVTPLFEDHELSVTPQFVDANTGNFRLAGNSPLLGYGTLNGTTPDLDGHYFPTHGKVDLGPYSETLFIDGFDNN
jgi:hypothetical protein